MAFGLDHALPTTGYGPSAGSASVPLSVPAGARVLLVQYTVNGVDGAHMPGAPGFGGVAGTQLAQVDGGGMSLGESSAALWEWDATDLAARASDELTFAYPQYRQAGVSATFVTGDGDVRRVDLGTASGTFPCLVTLDPGAEADGIAFVAGLAGGHPSGAIDASRISPYGAQTERSELAVNGNAAAGNTSSLASISAPTPVGVVVTSNKSAVIAALYSEGAVMVAPDRFGLAAGVAAGLSLVIGAERLLLPSPRFGLVAGVSLGLRLEVEGPRQVMLAGGPETTALTEGGAEGRVLTYHPRRKPTWEDAGGGPAEAGRWVPMTIDPAADGTPQLLFTDSGDVVMMRVMED